MKIEIILDEKSFDEQIGNAMKAKIRNVLRSDKQIAELIQQEVETEVAKKVATAFLLTEFDDQYLKTRIDKIFTDLEAKVANTASKKLEQLFAPTLEKRNQQVIAQLFAKEIKEIKSKKVPKSTSKRK